MNESISYFAHQQIPTLSELKNSTQKFGIDSTSIHFPANIDNGFNPSLLSSTMHKISNNTGMILSERVTNSVDLGNGQSVCYKEKYGRVVLKINSYSLGRHYHRKLNENTIAEALWNLSRLLGEVHGFGLPIDSILKYGTLFDSDMSVYAYLPSMNGKVWKPRVTNPRGNVSCQSGNFVFGNGDTAKAKRKRSTAPTPYFTVYNKALQMLNATQPHQQQFFTRLPSYDSDTDTESRNIWTIESNVRNKAMFDALKIPNNVQDFFSDCGGNARNVLNQNFTRIFGDAKEAKKRIPKEAEEMKMQDVGDHFAFFMLERMGMGKKEVMDAYMRYLVANKPSMTRQKKSDKKIKTEGIATKFWNTECKLDAESKKWFNGVAGHHTDNSEKYFDAVGCLRHGELCYS
jgi:hypothetical protein